jgi:hypothetical protein
MIRIGTLSGFLFIEVPTAPFCSIALLASLLLQSDSYMIGSFCFFSVDGLILPVVDSL